MNKYNDYINEVVKRGLLCERYKVMIDHAVSKKEIFEILCDSNGIEYLQKMQLQGIDIPYDILCKDFGSFINGRCNPQHKEGYSSSLYCRVSSIEARTTLVGILDCKCDVYVPKNGYSTLYIDGKSKVIIHGEDGSKVNVFYINEDSFSLDEYLSNGNFKTKKIKNV